MRKLDVILSLCVGGVVIGLILRGAIPLVTYVNSTLYTLFSGVPA